MQFLQIKEEDINFWKSGVDHMQLQHLNEMYPPRVKMTVTVSSIGNPNEAFKLPIKFEGPCDHDNRLDMELTFPLRGK